MCLRYRNPLTRSISYIYANYLNPCSNILSQIVLSTQKVEVKYSLQRYLIAIHLARQVRDPSSIALMRSKIRRLPAIHRETLRAIVEHLARVAAFSEKNKMDVRNLAIVFGTVIFGEEDMPKGGDLLSVQILKVA